MASKLLIERGGSVFSDLAMVLMDLWHCAPVDATTLNIDQDGRRVTVTANMVMRGTAGDAEELAEHARAATERRGHELIGNVVVDCTDLRPDQQKVNLVCRVALPPNAVTRIPSARERAELRAMSERTSRNVLDLISGAGRSE